jgi:LmbE family N-acetylglucosaminyl deacetylase
VVDEVAGIAARLGCKVVVAPWAGDPHCDHEAAAAIGAAVAARLGVGVLSYPVWGWLRDPDALVAEARTGGWRLDVTAQLAAKRRAIAAHRSQHGLVVEDAKDGFVLPARLLEVACRGYEVFIA